MSSDTWTPRAVSSAASHWRQAVWRIVGAQHVAFTMRIVDSAAEQDRLESLLETSKPALSDEAKGLDYPLELLRIWKEKDSGMAAAADIVSDAKAQSGLRAVGMASIMYLHKCISYEGTSWTCK